MVEIPPTRSLRGGDGEDEDLSFLGSLALQTLCRFLRYRHTQIHEKIVIG
jgi:hypothetical protein